MILTADYHTHTPYSHGKNTVAENAAQAKELGLKQIGITDHGFAHLAFGIKRAQVAALKAECAAAQKAYGIDVLVGVEANIQNTNGKSDLTEKDFENFDLYICGKHVLIAYTGGAFFNYFLPNLIVDKCKLNPSKGLIARNTKGYINLIKNNPVDIISHLYHRCPCDAVEVAKCAADYGTYIELNAAKNHLKDEVLAEIAAKTEARFVIDSDAHSASRVGDYKLALEQALRVGVPMERIDNIEGRLPSFRFKEYKKRM